jgi:hypothetical protein
VELDMNPLFIKNMLPRLDWEAMKTLAQEVRTLRVAFTKLLPTNPLILMRRSSVSPTYRTKSPRRKHCRPRTASRHRRSRTSTRS